MRYIFYGSALLFLMWLGGLSYFIYGLSQMAPPTEEKTDGIVALTGRNNRLQEAVRLLENGLSGKLFISGVNAQVTRGELLKLLGTSKALADCCIESGVAALNTVGNAREVSRWVARNNMTSIRVVTSLDHMPRALVEMRQFMPDITLIAHPVGSWHPDNIRFLPLVGEYSKYLASKLRAALTD